MQTGFVDRRASSTANDVARTVVPEPPFGENTVMI